MTTQITTINNTDTKIEEIAIENISIPITHPRRDAGDMASLVESIRKNGLQEPLTVSLGDDGKYQIIDGTRRFNVVISFGLKTVPCFVREKLNEAQVCQLAFIKNNERKNLNAIEVATHIRTMKERFGYSLREMDALGYGSPAKISQSLKLLDLPKPVQEMIVKGELTATHGTELVKLGTTQLQEKMAKQAIDFEWSARRTGNSVEKLISKGKKVIAEPVKVPEGDIPGVYFKDAKDMSELPERSVHLIVSSPPYYVGMEFEIGFSYDEHWENIEGVMNESARVLAPGGIMALNVGDIYNFKGPAGKNDFSQVQLVGHKYQTFLRKHNIYLTDVILWVKSGHAYPGKDVSKQYSDKTSHTDYRIIPTHDPVYIFRKKGNREMPSEEIALKSRITKDEWSKWASGIWKIENAKKMDGHPSIFPDELVQRLVKMFSFEGDTVLDPFLGSGTTVKVAREMNRQAYGYERLEQYKEVIMKKLGIEAAPAAETMADFAKRALTDGSVEPEVAAIEAEFFTKETAETEVTAERAEAIELVEA